jgi:hypothetical protein
MPAESNLIAEARGAAIPMKPQSKLSVAATAKRSTVDTDARAVDGFAMAEVTRSALELCCRVNVDEQ